MTVIGTAGTARGRQLVLEQGAHHVLDHTAPGYLEGADGSHRRPRPRRHPRDAGQREPPERTSGSSRCRVASSSSATAATSRSTPACAMNKDAAILGMALFHASPAQLVGIHAALVEGLRNGTLRPVIGQEFPLAQAARSHDVGDGSRSPRQDRAGALMRATALVLALALVVAWRAVPFTASASDSGSISRDARGPQPTGESRPARWSAHADASTCSGRRRSSPRASPCSWWRRSSAPTRSSARAGVRPDRDAHHCAMTAYRSAPVTSAQIHGSTCRSW